MTDWTLITGASEGLGREFADIAAASGRSVIVSARQKDKLEALAAELRTRHSAEAFVLPVVLWRPGEAERLWAAAADGRRIDILVNNAGLGYNGAFAGEDIGRETATLSVNAVALTVLMQEAVRHMLASGGGRIMNVASTAAFMPGPGMAVYHATKAYVLSLSEAVADELRGKPVTVTAFCPGATATNFARDAQMEGITLFKMGGLPSARSVADTGWRGMLAGRRVVVTGSMNKVFAFLPRLLPRSLVTRVAGVFLR